MGILRRQPDREWGKSGLPPDGASPALAAPASQPPRPGDTVSAQTAVHAVADGTRESARSELERRRDALAAQVTELHWDLGGLAYEMAIRDHFRLDVLVRRAALLQERDAELAEIERLLRMEQDGVAGACPSCGAPHSRGALYCWQCGSTLMERLPSAAAEHESTGSEVDALLSGAALPASWPAADGET